MAEVGEFMSESSSEDGEQLPSTTMANFQIPPPDVLELNEGSTASNWRTWVSAWNNYRLATKLDKEEEARQVATRLAVIGQKKRTRCFVLSHELSQTTRRKSLRLYASLKSIAFPGKILFTKGFSSLRCKEPV